MKRIAEIALVSSLFTMLAGYSAVAQTTIISPEPSSLGDYARKMHKDPPSKVKPKVFDNDNLPTDEKLSIVGEQTTASADNSAARDANSKPAASGDANNKDAGAKADDDEQARKQAEWKTWQTKLVGQKDAIDLSSRELDVLQKEYQLRAAAVYADVGNRLRNSAQWDKEDADYKQRIAEKQKAVEDAKQKLDDMEEEARKAGVPAAMRE